MASAPATRWRRRLVRTTELMTALPTYQRLHSANQFATGEEFPVERDAAIGSVADWCAAHDLCHDGVVRLVEQVFELDRATTLTALAENCGDRAARSLAANPDLPEAAAEHLLRSSAPVRAQLAGNHSIPRHLLDQLLRDPSPEVRHRAEWNPIFQRTFETPSYFLV